MRRRRRLAAAGAPADVTQVARVAGTARVACPARIRAAVVSGIGRSRGRVAAAWVSRVAAVARASGAGRVARGWTGVLSWWSRRRLARWSLRLISSRKRCRVRSRRRESRLRKSELCADHIQFQFRGGARASPCALGDLCVVGGENFLGDDRCRLGLRNGGCASRSAARTRCLRTEDDASREPVAAACACHLGKHRQTDRDPENGHDRERNNSRQEPGTRRGSRAWRTNASWTIDVRVPQDSLLGPPQASDGR
jgi:hypothetical protein